MMAVMGPSEALRRQTRRPGRIPAAAVQPSIEGGPPIIIVLRWACSAISRPIRQIGREPPHLYGNFRCRTLLLRCRRRRALNGKDPTFDAGFARAGVGRNPEATGLLGR